MRDKKYITMMDPFQIKYGNVLSGALVLPSLLVDVLWVSCTLLGLGKHWGESSDLWWNINPSHFGLVCFVLFSLSARSDHERDSGLTFRLFGLDLVSCCHHLHVVGRPLFSGLYWYHPALSHLPQPGELKHYLYLQVWALDDYVIAY